MNDSQKIRETIGRFYEILSGTKNEWRDWDILRSLFSRGACLVKNISSGSGTGSPSSYDVESYIKYLDTVLKKNNFFEEGYDYEIRISGNIAQVYSLYEARENPEQINPVKSGVNLIHLVRDGEEWKVQNMLWEDQ